MEIAVNNSSYGTTNPSVGKHSFNLGTVVTITATPKSGYQFVRWEGNVAKENSAFTTVTMNAIKNVTAYFERIPIITLLSPIIGNQFMTSKERLEAAILGTYPDRPPIVLPYFHLYLDHVAHELCELGWEYRMYGTPEEKARVYRLAKTYFGLDWLPVGGIGTAMNARSISLTECDGALFLRESSDGSMTKLPRVKPHEPPITKRIVDTIEDIDNGRLPAFLLVDEILATRVLDPVGILAEEFGDEIMLVGGVSMPGNLNYFYLGIYDMMTALKDEQDLIHRLVERSKSMIFNMLEAMKASGIGCVWMEDNFVGGDLISLDDYKTFFFRANTEIIATAKRLGLHTVYYLTGEVMSRLPCVMEMKPDCLAIEESKKTLTLDTSAIRKEAGENLCLFGNVDVYHDIELGDKESWRMALEEQKKAACPNGKLVLSAGSPVTFDTPKEKIRDFVKFAKYGVV